MHSSPKTYTKHTGTTTGLGQSARLKVVSAQHNQCLINATTESMLAFPFGDRFTHSTAPSTVPPQGKKADISPTIDKQDLLHVGTRLPNGRTLRQSASSYLQARSQKNTSPTPSPMTSPRSPASYRSTICLSSAGIDISSYTPEIHLTAEGHDGIGALSHGAGTIPWPTTPRLS
jgi:hypothetical protein